MSGAEGAGRDLQLGPEQDPHPNLDWLFALQRFGARAGLETMRELLAQLGSPELNYRTVVVGGTNGKGSVAALLAAQLQAAGHRTGLFTSPHLQRVGERARVDGAPASDAAMERLVGEVRPHAEAVGATFFEVVTAAALVRFARAGAERVVLEVGLGGRLDATNVTEPDLTVVTGVALDHTAILGTTLAAIAREKAGILRPGVPLVTAATGEALEVLAEHAARLGAPLLRYGHEFEALDAVNGWGGVGFTLRWRPWPDGGRPLPSSGRPPPGSGRPPLGSGGPPRGSSASVLGAAGALKLESPLIGRHQVVNVAQAAVGALTLGVPPRVVRSALADARWPGRLERFAYRGRFVVLDGAHNPQAARALAAALRELEGEVALLIMGVSREKDVGSLLPALGGVARRVLFTRARNSPRALPPDDLLAAWRAAGEAPAEAVADPAAALELAVATTAPGETIVVAGSLFLVGEVRNLLEDVPAEPFERWQ